MHDLRKAKRNFYEVSNLQWLKTPPMYEINSYQIEVQ